MLRLKKEKPVEIVRVNVLDEYKSNVTNFQIISDNKIKIFTGIIEETKNINKDIEINEKQIKDTIAELTENLNKLEDVRSANEKVIKKFEALLY